MQIRRLVTGHTADGKATVVGDIKVDAITVDLVPGWEFFRLWGADETVTFPDNGKPYPYTTYFPRVGGFRFGLLTVPPESAKIPKDTDFKTLLEEMESKLPGMIGHMELDNQGMHTTDTVDFVYVISGEVSLELDNGEEVYLRSGDTVIQNGTRHAWRNRGGEPCKMAVCLIGAHRKQV